MSQQATFFGSLHFSSPLEQFSIISFGALPLGNFIFSFTNSAFFMLLSLMGFLKFMEYGTKTNGLLIPNTFQSLAELLYKFIFDLVFEQIGKKGVPYFPLIFSLFTFIISLNLIGMIPYGFTATSHLVITFGLSVSMFIGITLIGFKIHGIHFFGFLLPPGAPLALAPLLVVLELVSYGFRAISLGVRLFANMMAGHTLVTILAGFG